MITGSKTGHGIEIEGLENTLNALRGTQPDLARALNKEIRNELNIVKRGAEGRYPKGEWTVSILAGKAPLGRISAAKGSLNPTSWGESDAGAKASVFEFIGKSYTGSDPQVVGLIRSLDDRYGSPGRFLWDSWDAANQGDNGVIRTLEQIVVKYEGLLQERLNNRGVA